jgi:hypothetical protein
VRGANDAVPRAVRAAASVVDTIDFFKTPLYDAKSFAEDEKASA